MKNVIKLSTFTFLSILILSLNAQKTLIYDATDAQFKDGKDLFDKNQFVNAQKKFSDFINTTNSSLLKEESLFYNAACGIELFNKDSEWLMKLFIEKYPASLKLNDAYYYLGKSNFRKKKYKESLDYFDKIDIYKLDKEQLAEFYFKRGYSYLQTGNDLKAKADFFEIKDKENKYTFPAVFYFAHIAYVEKNYESAYLGFKRLINNETFGSIAPYYITQIYFVQGKFESVVKEAPNLFNDSVNLQRADEINRMIGESYFKLNDYSNAINFLKKTELGSGLNSEGNYALGFCYYKINELTKAILSFEKIILQNDSISQNTAYHLADCYVRLSDKLKAKNYFYKALQLDFNKKITEDALFSFAKLGYELDFNPYNEAVIGFTSYLKKYPDSPRKEECYNFLVNVYSTTKNYNQAITNIESLDQIDPILKVTYQKLIYFKGVEFFNNGDLMNAEKQFKKSLLLNADLKLNCLNQYWLGELSFIRKDYTSAIDAWRKFQEIPGGVQLHEYDLSNYALGYAYFQRKQNNDYETANIYFRKFLLSKDKYGKNKETDEKSRADYYFMNRDFTKASLYYKTAYEYKVADATVRTGDCYFMMRDFNQASEYYKIAFNLNKIDMDYSLYQKALCDGLNKNYSQKIDELKKIIDNYPESNYKSAALNQIADTYYKNLKDEVNAIIYYDKILQNYPNSSFSNNCYAQLGNIYYGKNDDEKALYYYDKFVRADNKSDDAKNVLESIKKIYETKGDLVSMEQYFIAIGNPLSENELEKATYSAAYDAYYVQKNCDLAMQKWEVYLSKFTNGKYISEAQFCNAECAFSKNMFDKAILGYQFIISNPRGIYSEVSLFKTSYLLYKDKNYAAALPVFLQLQNISETPSNINLGKIGSMRCAFYLNQFETANTESDKVLSIEKLTPQQMSEAKYMKAKSLYELNRLDDALIEFGGITRTAKNITGAESYYYTAKIYFAKQDFQEVIKVITKLISYEYSNDDWNNKGMLLLADAYIALEDISDAEIIIQTIKDSNPKQVYLEEANKKNEVIKLKKEIQAIKIPKIPIIEMKLEFSQSKKDSLLFYELNNELLLDDDTKKNKN